ncbi:uncharacterized protein LY89DRAFT_738173 [Mollisia scopiformis]|uniref:Transcription factor domain-containing protein n=1 Tax=Mollisia scopiformis TaxID=149040 RepID=A0A194WXG9_MOLSC|nr:uncharacterized protein LY89DRAFT_738173 [Mollisia scopiformis]KUJ12384.1 hypothetical protein LY89DRAFT_738173 [Mollisia scopiformis]
MTKQVPDTRTLSEPLMGNPLPPPTDTNTSPVTSSVYRDSCPKPNPESGPFVKSGGFFGPTNFSAVFQEHSSNLGDEDIQITAESEAFGASYESIQSQTFLMLPGNELRGSPRVALGTKVLGALPDQQTCRFLLSWYQEKCRGYCSPKESHVALANSLWITYTRQLAEPRRLESLEELSSILCKNGESGLEEFEDWDGWFISCSGANLRWETLGGVFGALTSAVLSLPERDPFFSTQLGKRRNRKEFSIELKDCVQTCVTLSSYTDLMNVPMVELLLTNLRLQTVISGDISLVVWRQLGDLVSAVTALGLHRLSPGGPITFLSEIKKRIFNRTFYFSMSNSLLTGRPPHLSHRFCHIELALDVSDEVLMKGEQELQTAIAALDSNGWNREGNIDLMARIEQTYDSFPDYLKFKLADVSNPEIPDRKLWTRLTLRLMMLEHRLLIERLAFKQNILDGQSMVDCAREMLDLSVLIWVQRDRFIEHHHNYDWMLMCRGIPASGVLCVELLKQTKQPQGTRMLHIPRSEVVQNLSLLIGFLEWVKPSAGNYQLCARIKHIIKKILDQILNPNQPSSAPPASQQLATEWNGFDDSMPYDPMVDVGFDNGIDDLDWLNTVDWSRGPWVDLQDFSGTMWD